MIEMLQGIVNKLRFYQKVENLICRKVIPTSTYQTDVCRISKLGSGSDFEAYFIRLGIAAGRARYTKNKVQYFIVLTHLPTLDYI